MQIGHKTKGRRSAGFKDALNLKIVTTPDLGRENKLGGERRAVLKRFWEGGWEKEGGRERPLANYGGKKNVARQAWRQKKKREKSCGKKLREQPSNQGKK